jgi:hypothetical protein
LLFSTSYSGSIKALLGSVQALLRLYLDHI